jgi:hypothetical protein
MKVYENYSMLIAALDKYKLVVWFWEWKLNLDETLNLKNLVEDIKMNIIKAVENRSCKQINGNNCNRWVYKEQLYVKIYG